MKVVKCKGCEYWKPLSDHTQNGVHCCHYLLETGNVRGIPAEQCYKHENTPYKEKRRYAKNVHKRN